MKKLLLILAIAVIGCSEDEKENCNCTGKYMLSNGNTYLVPKQPIDCETKQPTQLAQSGFFVGCVD
jgi:predicted CoA-binding protein